MAVALRRRLRQHDAYSDGDDRGGSATFSHNFADDSRRGITFSHADASQAAVDCHPIRFADADPVSAGPGNAGANATPGNANVDAPCDSHAGDSFTDITHTDGPDRYAPA